jgi:hypothetical protein
MKRIEIIIAPSGKTKLFTKGFQGSECLDASTSLAEAGGKTIDDRLTSEYFDIQDRVQQRTERRQLGSSNQTYPT